MYVFYPIKKGEVLDIRIFCLLIYSIASAIDYNHLSFIIENHGTNENYFLLCTVPTQPPTE